MTDSEKLKIAIEFIAELSERGGCRHAECDYEAGAYSADDFTAQEAAEVLERIR